ncbi:MAG: hypothetical protein QOI12_415 [Alphaproteobacteria bacterium]|nr:hypothetical protein [Alphaproteobacteria bacterium]
MVARGVGPGMAGVLLMAAGVTAFGQSCPAPLAQARRLILVTAESMSTPLASVQIFERAAPAAPWRAVAGAEPVVVGLAGMAWGTGFRHLAGAGEPIKVEGDKRAPAGIYPVGRSFGFAASSRPGYLRLADDTVCVDDLASPAYNTITSRAAVGRTVSGEDMRKIDLYRRGLVVDYPADRAARAGSCIFIHIWRGPGRGTAGCVAMPEAKVASLQDFAQGGAVIAILPRRALERFSGCLPTVDATR